MRPRQAIGEFIDSRVSSNLSPLTIAWYRTRLERFAEFCPDLPQEPRSLEAFLATINGTPETRHAYFRALRAFFRFISDRYGTSNPMNKVAAPRCPKKLMATLEPEQVMGLLISASNLRDRAVLTLVIDTAMRADIPAPKLGPHRIRHAFGKGYLVNGGDLRSLQQIMGHASITTTEKYASLNLSDTIKKHHSFSLLQGVRAAATKKVRRRTLNKKNFLWRWVNE